MTQSDHLRRIRFWLAVFIIGLVLSGVTAFPLETELSLLVSILHAGWLRPISELTGLLPWIERVYNALHTTNANYPFLAYGTDWLAFAHLMIAVAFIGPFIEPVRNKWFITFGLIACAGVIPLALIAGAIRGIPFPWRLIDCSFGLFGAVPLLVLQAINPCARTRKSPMKPTANSASAKPSRRSRPIAQSFVLMVATMIAGLTIRFVPLGLPVSHRQVWRIDTLGANDLLDRLRPFAFVASSCRCLDQCCPRDRRRVLQTAPLTGIRRLPPDHPRHSLALPRLLSVGYSRVLGRHLNRTSRGSPDSSRNKLEFAPESPPSLVVGERNGRHGPQDIRCQARRNRTTSRLHFVGTWPEGCRPGGHPENDFPE